MVLMMVRRAGKCARGQTAAGAKHEGDKVWRGGAFGYYLWPRASSRLKPRSIAGTRLPEKGYEGLSTASSHGHVRNDQPSNFTSAANSSPVAHFLHAQSTPKSNQKWVNMNCYSNKHCLMLLCDPLDENECLVGA